MDDAHAPALTFEFHVIVCVTNQCSSFNFLQPLKNVKTILNFTGCTNPGGRWELSGVGWSTVSLSLLLPKHC